MLNIPSTLAQEIAWLSYLASCHEDQDTEVHPIGLYTTIVLLQRLYCFQERCRPTNTSIEAVTKAAIACEPNTLPARSKILMCSAYV